MDRFVLHSEYKPTGDQPRAIADLVKGFREGNQFQTLLGVTGSGKTITMSSKNFSISFDTKMGKTDRIKQNERIAKLT